jgi:transporter family-2 protein
MFGPLLTLISGLLSSFQGTINNQISRDFSLPAMILAVSFVQGSIAIVWLLISGYSLSIGSLIQGRIFLAGLLGVLIMAVTAWSISKIGVLTTYGLIIFGQLTFSFCADLLGLFGVQQRLPTMGRTFSLGLMGAAVLLLMRNK